jgi:hypothetical protein
MQELPYATVERNIAKAYYTAFSNILLLVCVAH